MKKILSITYVLAGLAALASIPMSSYADELPVGDGKVSASPKAGYVFSCTQEFRVGGARHVGDWFHGKTWDPTQKPHVEGKVMWPMASFTITQQGNSLEVKGNSLPVGQPTGTFPISRDDPAYQFDTNPNPIAPISMTFQIPVTPKPAKQLGCLSMAMIGITTTGVAIYNALDDAGRDAAAHEVQDLCDGHPQGRGQYHYHSSSPCLPGASKNALVGWALDGYPILGVRDAAGKQLGNSDLDVCHGREEAIKVDGRSYDYAYRLTEEYPYTLGCFTGQVSDQTKQSARVGKSLRSHMGSKGARQE